MNPYTLLRDLLLREPSATLDQIQKKIPAFRQRSADHLNVSIFNAWREIESLERA